MCAPLTARGTRATASRPSYSKSIGGIDMKTSSVRRATSAWRSADSHARTNFATIASSKSESGGRRGFEVGGLLPPPLQTGAHPLQRAVDRFESRTQHVGNLTRLESEDIAQYEDGYRAALAVSAGLSALGAGVALGIRRTRAVSVGHQVAAQPEEEVISQNGYESPRVSPVGRDSSRSRRGSCGGTRAEAWPWPLARVRVDRARERSDGDSRFRT
jgi:hypothetical protein